MSCVLDSLRLLRRRTANLTDKLGPWDVSARPITKARGFSAPTLMCN